MLISRVGDTIRTYHLVQNRDTGAAITNLTGDNFRIILALDGSPAVESVDVAHVLNGYYCLSFIAGSPGEYSMSAELLDNFEGSDQGGFTAREFSVLAEGAALPWWGVGLISLDDVKQALGVEQNYNEFVIQELIAGVSEAIAAYLGQDFEDHTVVPTDDVYNGNGRQTLFLGRRSHVVGVEGVTIDGLVVPKAAGPRDAGWVLDGHELHLRHHYRFHHGFQNVVVSTRWGWASPPPRARLACLQWVVVQYKDIVEHPGQLSIRIGDETSRFQVGPMPEFVAQLLEGLINQAVA